MRDQAAELAEAGRFTQAAELLARWLRGAVERPADLRGARFQLAHTLLLGGEFGRALPEFQTIAAELAALRGPADGDVLRCRVQIAACHAELGERITPAIDELKAALAIESAERGPSDLGVLDLRRQIGMLLTSSGDLDSAGRVLRELLEDMVAFFGHDHLAVRDLRKLVGHVTSFQTDR